MWKEKTENSAVEKRLLLLEDVVDNNLFLTPGIGRDVVLSYPCADHQQGSDVRYLAGTSLQTNNRHSTFSHVL